MTFINLNRNTSLYCVVVGMILSWQYMRVLPACDHLQSPPPKNTQKILHALYIYFGTKVTTVCSDEYQLRSFWTLLFFLFVLHGARHGTDSTRLNGWTAEKSWFESLQGQGPLSFSSDFPHRLCGLPRRLFKRYRHFFLGRCKLAVA
jgi:hypothetical protein